MSVDRTNEYSGNTNLEIISENYRFNDWMFEQVNKGLRDTKGNILEVGSGLEHFLKRLFRIGPLDRK